MTRLTQRQGHTSHQASKKRQQCFDTRNSTCVLSMRNFYLVFLVFAFGFTSTIVQASSVFSKNIEISLRKVQTFQRPYARELMDNYSLKYSIFQKVRQNELSRKDLTFCNTKNHIRSIAILENLRGGSSGRNGNEGGYYDYRDDPYYSDRREETTNSRSNYDYDEDRYRSQRYDDRRDYYEDDYYEKRPDSRSSSKPKSSSKNRPNSTTFLPSNIPGITAPNRKVGFVCIGSGMAFTLLGISLFFNKTLLRLGNILFLLGIPLTLGPSRTVGYFLQPKKARATACLAFGIFLVLVGHPVLGIALEVFGLLNLFGNMFPILLMFLRNIPVVGDLIPESKNKKKKTTSSGSYGDERRYNNDDRYSNDYRDNDAERYY